MLNTNPSKPPRTALVTGGSGFVGGRLIPHLLAHGWRVRALARSAQSEAQVKALGATPVRGELNDAQALPRHRRHTLDKLRFRPVRAGILSRNAHTK